jgi:hypothetical protein
MIRWALAEHARHPNETNLDAHYLIPKEGIWGTYLQSRNPPGHEMLVQPRAAEPNSASSGAPEPAGPRVLVDNTPASTTNFTTLAATPKPPPAPSMTIKPAPPSVLLPKLRWANIGWSYHWGTKQYDFARERGAIDSGLRDLCKGAVALVNWQQVYGNSENNWGENEPSWSSWNETYGISVSLKPQ